MANLDSVMIEEDCQVEAWYDDTPYFVEQDGERIQKVLRTHTIQITRPPCSDEDADVVDLEITEATANRLLAELTARKERVEHFNSLKKGKRAERDG